MNAVLLSDEACRLAEARAERMNENGFSLRSGQDPALTPIVLHSEHEPKIRFWLAENGIGDDGNGYLFASPLPTPADLAARNAGKPLVSA